jgi:hypothetical protein
MNESHGKNDQARTALLGVRTVYTGALHRTGSSCYSHVPQNCIAGGRYEKEVGCITASYRSWPDFRSGAG